MPLTIQNKIPFPITQSAQKSKIKKDQTKIQKKLTNNSSVLDTSVDLDKYRQLHKLKGFWFIIACIEKFMFLGDR